MRRNTHLFGELISLLIRLIRLGENQVQNNSTTNNLNGKVSGFTLRKVNKVCKPPRRGKQVVGECKFNHVVERLNRQKCKWINFTISIGKVKNAQKVVERKYYLSSNNLMIDYFVSTKISASNNHLIIQKKKVLLPSNLESRFAG